MTETRLYKKIDKRERKMERERAIAFLKVLLNIQIKNSKVLYSVERRK